MVLKNNPCIYVGIIFYGEDYMENKLLTKRGYYWKFASDISSDNLNFINEDIKEKYYEMTA